VWHDYFPLAEIFGFDLNDFSAVRIPRCNIFRGDMGSRQDLARLVEQSGGAFDIIIDDASHASHHQQIALASLFPHLNPDGFYFIEDLHTQPTNMELPGPKTRDWLRRAELTRDFSSPHLTLEEAATLNTLVASVALFDSLAIKPTKGRDALAVLRP
jgi:hypothetical protein